MTASDVSWIKKAARWFVDKLLAPLIALVVGWALGNYIDLLAPTVKAVGREIAWFFGGSMRVVPAVFWLLFLFAAIAVLGAGGLIIGRLRGLREAALAEQLRAADSQQRYECDVFKFSHLPPMMVEWAWVSQGQPWLKTVHCAPHKRVLWDRAHSHAARSAAGCKECFAQRHGGEIGSMLEQSFGQLEVEIQRRVRTGEHTKAKDNLARGDVDGSL